MLSSDPESDPKKNKTDDLKGGGGEGEEDELSEVSDKGVIVIRLGLVVDG